MSAMQTRTPGRHTVMKISDRIRIAFALAITTSCASVHVAQGLSGEPYPESSISYADSVQDRTFIESEPEALLTVMGEQVSLVPAPTTTAVSAPTLLSLVHKYFEEDDHEWALTVAFCESSAQPDHETSDAVNSSSGAAGWFQHLPKFWEERTEAAGIPDADILDPEANVLVAAWLLYETPQQTSHWYPSEWCWG